MLKTLQDAPHLSAEEDGGSCHICVTGEIDHHNAAALRRSLDEYIVRVRPRVLRLDTSGVSFMDSSGLGLIMGRLALLQKSGGELILCHPSGNVLRILRLAGMDRLVKIEPQPEQ